MHGICDVFMHPAVTVARGAYKGKVMWSGPGMIVMIASVQLW